MTDLANPEVQKILQSKSFAYLATIGPHGEPHLSAMWFQWDGEYIKFTHTSERQKYRNIRHDPRVSVCITDPDNPYIALELRGTVERVEKDPTGAFYNTLSDRYGSNSRYSGDPRVILYVKVSHVTGQGL